MFHSISWLRNIQPQEHNKDFEIPPPKKKTLTFLVQCFLRKQRWLGMGVWDYKSSQYLLSHHPGIWLHKLFPHGASVFFFIKYSSIFWLQKNIKSGRYKPKHCILKSLLKNSREMVKDFILLTNIASQVVLNIFFSFSVVQWCYWIATLTAYFWIT